MKNHFLIIAFVLSGTGVIAQNYNYNFNNQEANNPPKTKRDTFPRITITDPSKSKPSEFISNTYYWLYGKYQFTATLKVKNSDYDYYRKLPKSLSYERYAEDHEGHRYFADLCRQLDEEAKQAGYEGIELVNFLTAFVQQGVPYVLDMGEYKKYPIETIAEYGGDCEDKAALLAALLNTFGFDACMVWLPGHMVVGISCTNCGGYYEHEGKKYSFIETTAGGWRIGQVPQEYQMANATILEVTHTDYYKRDENQYAKRDDRKKNRIGKTEEDDNWSDMVYVEPQPKVRYTYPSQPKPVYAPDYTPIYRNEFDNYLPYPVFPESAPQGQPRNSPIQILPNGNGGKITIFGQTLIRW